MLREFLVEDIDGNKQLVTATPFKKMPVGGAEGTKYKTRVMIGGEQLPMVAKEYSYLRPEDTLGEAMGYFQTWAMFKRLELPVPKRMYLSSIKPDMAYLLMSDVGIGLRRLVGFNTFMRQEEIDAACEPFSRKQYKQIAEETNRVEAKAGSCGLRINFHNWHIGEEARGGGIRVFLLDLGCDNYQVDPNGKHIDALCEKNRLSLVAFWNWLRV